MVFRFWWLILYSILDCLLYLVFLLLWLSWVYYVCELMVIRNLWWFVFLMIRVIRCGLECLMSWSLLVVLVLVLWYFMLGFLLWCLIFMVVSVLFIGFLVIVFICIMLMVFGSVCFRWVLRYLWWILFLIELMCVGSVNGDDFVWYGLLFLLVFIVMRWCCLCGYFGYFVIVIVDLGLVCLCVCIVLILDLGLFENYMMLNDLVCFLYCNYGMVGLGEVMWFEIDFLVVVDVWWEVLCDDFEYEIEMFGVEVIGLVVFGFFMFDLDWLLLWFVMIFFKMIIGCWFGYLWFI